MLIVDAIALGIAAFFGLMAIAPPMEKRPPLLIRAWFAIFAGVLIVYAINSPTWRAIRALIP